MKVILRKDDPKIGEKDSLVDVSDGYARNYLFPRKIAVLATPPEIAALEKRKAEREKIMAEKRSEFEAQAQKLSSLEVSIRVDAGEGGKIFGSVTPQDIADEVKKASQVDIDKKKIDLDVPIKAVGEYSVPIKIYKDISASVKVKVIAK